MTLDKLRSGHTAELVDIQAGPSLRGRLMELGLTPGTRVSILRVAPLGDPIELHTRGFRLTLRKSDAAGIICRTE